MALRLGHGAMMGKLHGLIDEPIIEAFFFFFLSLQKLRWPWARHWAVLQAAKAVTALDISVPVWFCWVLFRVVYLATSVLHSTDRY